MVKFKHKMEGKIERFREEGSFFFISANMFVENQVTLCGNLCSCRPQKKVVSI